MHHEPQCFSGELPDQLGIVNSPGRGAFVILVLIPIAMIVFCTILGVLLAEIEGVRDFPTNIRDPFGDRAL